MNWVEGRGCPVKEGSEGIEGAGFMEEGLKEFE